MSENATLTSRLKTQALVIAYEELASSLLAEKPLREHSNENTFNKKT